MTPIDEIRIRVADGSEAEKVHGFYAAEGRSPRVLADERFVLAEASANNELVGVVRLCREHGHLVLRTMRVREAFRRQGIGKRMLEAFERLLGDRDCYCLPYSHLTSFYGRIGFAELPAGKAPPHLQERLQDYLSEGMDALVMKRPGQPNRLFPGPK